MNKIQRIVKNIKPIDKKIFKDIQQRLDSLTKPLGSLGKLEEIAKRLVAITEKENPPTDKKVVFTLAADHGVTEEGITAYPKEVTAQMIYNFMRGGAGINVLAKHIGAKVIVVDIGVAEDINVGQGFSLANKFINKKINYGTKNFTKGPAMTPEQAEKSVITGIELVEDELETGIDLVVPGDMGIGNTTASSAVTSVITNTPVDKVTGKGTGIDDSILKHKIDVIEKAIKKNEPDSSNPIDILSKIGGFEIGGLTGIILASAANRIPVILDGFISTTSALLASVFQPSVKDYLFAGHCSMEPGHLIQLDWLGLHPILNLDLRLGEGTGGVLAMNIVEAGVKILTQMATFESANVSKKT